ncbi:MAG: hypothetical protein SVV03_06015 [Candidatus Nanohaloarchaea archaeon]|nr:hypothetical protein [Candidatus Nanohaloarchaea archaeon]
MSKEDNESKKREEVKGFLGDRAAELLDEEEEESEGKEEDKKK